MKAKQSPEHDQIGENFSIGPGDARTCAACILFRVDAGPQIGLGHLQRCLSLAAALRGLGAMCIFLTNGNLIAQHRVTARGFRADRLEAIEPGGSGDLKHTLDVAIEYRCDALVVDSYYADADYLERLRAAGLFVVGIDDLARYPFPCQLVVNGGAHAHQLSYCSSSGGTRFLLGPQFALLRPEFWGIPPRKVRESVQNVLVTLGGTDPHNSMPRFVEMLDEMPGGFSVTVVVGPFFDDKTEVAEAARGSRRCLTLVSFPDSVAPLMQAADLAISAAGQTLYELACVGCPTVALEVVVNQAGQLRALAEAGAVYAAGRIDSPTIVEQVAAACAALLQDPLARARMSACGPRLVDGRGALRVARAILASIGKTRLFV